MSSSQIKSSLLHERKNKYILHPVADPKSAAARMYMAYFGSLNGIARIDSIKCAEFNDPNSFVIINAADLPLLKTPPKCNLIVFMTDIIRLDTIVRMVKFISLIVTTSELQSRIMSSVLPVECFTALEPIDPYYDKTTAFASLNYEEKAELVLFGYSNSLERTSSHLAPFLNSISSRFETIVFSEALPPSFRICTRCHFIEFSKIIQNLGSRFRYVVLSDVPVDLSVSTLAKSDNKLISSIRMGFLPLIAKGSRYLKWLPDDYPYTFSNPYDLIALVNSRLDTKTDAHYFESNLVNIPASYQEAHFANLKEFTLTLNQVTPALGINSEYPCNSWPGDFSYSLKDSLHDLRKSFSQTMFNRLFRLRHLLAS